MQNYTNAQILTAILEKWGKPMVPMFSGMVQSRISGSMGVHKVEEWMKQLGMARPDWSFASELSGLVSRFESAIISPFLNGALSNINDRMIPEVAHNLVDKAIESGEPVSLFDGHVTIKQEDFIELKKYLDANLPYAKTEKYIVKDDRPDSTTADTGTADTN